jgi:hypothetical protein
MEKNIELENAVVDTLKQAGIPEDMVGYDYLKTAVLLSLEDTETNVQIDETQ